MSEAQELYAQLKPVMEAIAEPLFEFSLRCLKERGAFLPHAVSMLSDGEIILHGATTGSADGTSTPAEILPILHSGLRRSAREADIVAIGVAEGVTVTRDGYSPTKAVKVQFEHKLGLAVALYKPYSKKKPKHYEYGEMFSVLAAREINAWLQA